MSGNASNASKAPKRQRREPMAAAAKTNGVVSRAKPDDWGQLGPAMRALPNNEWRLFCYALVTGPGGYGKYTAAARAAGLGKNSTPSNLGKFAWQLAHDSRMIAAVAEMAQKYLRGAHPEAVNALHNMIRDPGHRDHGRAVLALLDRVDPIVSKQNIEVTHRILDPDQEALEELQALRQLGVSREKMIENFGGNGLARLKRLEAAEMARRADQAKVIEVGANV
jgi:hypothetical protein